MIEKVFKHFQTFDCPLLKTLTLKNNPDLIDEIFFTQSEGRQKLLTWYLKTVDSSSEWNKFEDFLLATGTCSKPDAEAFISVKAPTRKQEEIWTNLSMLLVDSIDEFKIDEESRIEDAENCQRKLEKCLDELCLNSNFSGSVHIIPFSLEREVKSMKKDAPTVSRLLAIERKGLEELSAHSSVDEYQPQEIEGVVEKAGETADRLMEVGDKFQTVFRNKFESLVPKDSNVKLDRGGHPEIEAAAATLEEISQYIENNVKLAEANHHLQSLRTNEFNGSMISPDISRL